MNEKLYRTMSITGAGNIAIGIIVAVIGMVTGILAIINGAKLLSSRKNILL